MLLKPLSNLLFFPDWTIVMFSWEVLQLAVSNLCNWSTCCSEKGI